MVTKSQRTAKRSEQKVRSRFQIVYCCHKSLRWQWARRVAPQSSQKDPKSCWGRCPNGTFIEPVVRIFFFFSGAILLLSLRVSLIVKVHVSGTLENEIDWRSKIFIDRQGSLPFVLRFIHIVEDKARYMKYCIYWFSTENISICYIPTRFCNALI